MLGLIYGRPLNFLFEMIENLSDDDRVPVTRDHFDGATTLDAGLDINLEYPFQVLGPDHGRVPLPGGIGAEGSIHFVRQSLLYEAA